MNRVLKEKTIRDIKREVMANLTFLHVYIKRGNKDQESFYREKSDYFIKNFPQVISIITDDEIEFFLEKLQEDILAEASAMEGECFDEAIIRQDFQAILPNIRRKIKSINEGV